MSHVKYETIYITFEMSHVLQFVDVRGLLSPECCLEYETNRVTYEISQVTHASCVI